jgi:hypothetical protein
VYLECVCPYSPRANKKRPQPGEDGYGRLVRAQQGRGGVVVRMPSNCVITRTGGKSSATSVCSAGQTIGGLGKEIAEPNFALERPCVRTMSVRRS